MAVDVGELAPDFELKNQFGETIKLSDFGGGNHLPGTTSLDGATLVAALRDVIKEFARHGVRRICLMNGHFENSWFIIEGIDLALRELRWSGIDDMKIVVLSYWDFVSDDVVTFGISCDSDAALKVFAEQENYDYDLLSDYWPHGGVARSFGAFLEDKGFATRATFVIDKDGVVRWKVINGPGDTRSNDDYREALAAL